MCSCGWILRTAFSFSLRWLRRHISYGMNIRQQVTLKIVCNNKYEVLFCSQHTTKLSLTNYVQQQKRNIFFSNATKIIAKSLHATIKIIQFFVVNNNKMSTKLMIAAPKTSNSNVTNATIICQQIAPDIPDLVPDIHNFWVIIASALSTLSTPPGGVKIPCFSVTARTLLPPSL